MSTGNIEPIPTQTIRSEGRLDPDLAAKTMGEANMTVLPEPMIGNYTVHSKPWVKLSCEVPEGCPPMLLDRLVQRLQEAYHEIVWVDPGPEVVSPARLQLAELGFRTEMHYDPIGMIDRQVLIWRSPLA